MFSIVANLFGLFRRRSVIFLVVVASCLGFSRVSLAIDLNTYASQIRDFQLQTTSNTLKGKKQKHTKKQMRSRMHVNKLVRKFRQGGGGASSVSGARGAPIGFNLGHMPYSAMGCEGVTNLVHAGFPDGQSAWISQGTTTSPWNDGRAFPQQFEDGPPVTLANQYAVMALCPGAQGVLKPGKFVVTWDGGTSQSDVQVMSAATNVISFGSNRLTFDVNADANNPYILLRVKNPLVSGRIRNIRVVRAENESSQYFFTQKFVDLLKGSGFSVLRMLNVSGANYPSSRPEAFRSMSWSQRVNPDAQVQGDEHRGIALEHMVELASRVGADLYYTVPHTATDDFIAEAVSLFDSRLPNNLRIILEFSNEVWNGQFGQTAAALQEGRARGFQVINDDLATLRRAYGCRTVELAAVARRVLSQRQSNRVLEIALAFQNANVQTLIDAATYRCSQGQSAREVVRYAVSAPYFGNSAFFTNPNNAQQMINLGVTGLLSRMAQEADNVVSRFASTIVPTIRNLGLAPGLYEGGTHLAWFPDIPAALEYPLTRVFAQVVDNPAMYTIYRRYIEGLLAVIPDGFYLDYRLDGVSNNFSNFGKLNNFEMAAAGNRPRLDAINDIIAASLVSAEPSVSAIAPQSIRADHSEFILVQGTGMEGTQVRVAGFVLPSVIVKPGLSIVEIPAGVPEGRYPLQIVREGSFQQSNSVMLEVKRGPSLVRPIIAAANAGNGPWQGLDTRYGVTLAIYGQGFSSLSRLYIDGVMLPLASYTVVRSDMILMNFLGDFEPATHILQVADGGAISNPYAINLERR